MSANANKAAPGQAIARVLVAWPAGLLALGLAVWWAGRRDFATLIFAAAVLPVVAALVVQIVQSLRRQQVGLDIVALLSMSGALLLGETLAGNVVALMYAGGQLLENYAANRARREMTALLARAPKTAMKDTAGGLAEVPTGDLEPGDRVLVRNGDVVPVDGTVASETALVDQSALTGESLPVRRGAGGF
ncbi:MAG: heavy metal translocating P-type ATPase, partial [Bauldia sp.]|nr:heavy metal translocating P-type ATPase [Bauldia sp.]